MLLIIISEQEVFVFYSLPFSHKHLNTERKGRREGERERKKERERDLIALHHADVSLSVVLIKMEFFPSLEG